MLIKQNSIVVYRRNVASGNIHRLVTTIFVAAASLTFIGQTFAQNKPNVLFDRLPVAVKSAKMLKMVGDSFPPYRIVAEDGKTITGIDTDLARALEPILGVKIEQTMVSNLPAMLAGIDTERYDLTAGPLASNKAREERYDMITWLVSKPAFILPVAAGRKTSKLEDLCGLRIVYPGGTVQEETIKKLTERCLAGGLAAMQPVPLADQNASILAVQAGRGDVAGIQLASGLYLQKQNPGKFHIQTDQTDALGILNQGFVTKKNSGLTPVLFDALKQLWATGEYARIMEKWGLSAAKASEPRLNPSSSK